MPTLRRTANHTLSRRAALQCLGLGALATAWPASAAVLAVEIGNERPADSLPTWLTFPERQWQRITPAEAGIDTVAYERLLAQSQIGPKGWGGIQPDNRQWGAVLTHGGYLVQTWGDPQTMISIAKTNTGGFPFGAEVGTSGNFAFPAHLITGPVASRGSGIYSEKET